MDYKQIVWLASYPKSGNTWVRLFLDAYFFGDIDINEILTSVADDRAGLYALGDGSKTEDMPIDIQQLTRPMAMLRLVKQAQMTNRGIPLYVKTHTANMIANGVELIPAALTKGVVYIVRDPRDVLPSFAKHMGASMDDAVEWMNDKYRSLASRPGNVADFLSSWHGNVSSFLNDDVRPVKLIRYEDLREDPVKYFTEILEFSGVTPDPFKVRDAVKKVELSRVKKIEAEEGFKESSPHAKNQFFGEGKVGGWEDKLTPKQKFRIEKDFGRVMKRLGYLKQRAA